MGKFDLQKAAKTAEDIETAKTGAFGRGDNRYSEEYRNSVVAVYNALAAIDKFISKLYNAFSSIMGVAPQHPYEIDDIIEHWKIIVNCVNEQRDMKGAFKELNRINKHFKGFCAIKIYGATTRGDESIGGMTYHQMNNTVRRDVPEFSEPALEVEEWLVDIWEILIAKDNRKKNEV